MTTNHQYIKHSGADWVERSREKSPKYWKNSDKPMSSLGIKVADLLGQVFAGIYHIDREVTRVDWSDEYVIQITLYDGRDFSTFDSDILTRLVLLCHYMNVRMDLEGAAYHYIRLTFCNVTKRGFFREGHPTLDEAIEKVKVLVPDSILEGCEARA